MKTRSHSTGTTLIETLVTAAVVVSGGVTFFWLLSSVTTLAGKNEAVNQSHQEARRLINHAVADIHRSVSLPVLVDANLNVVAGNGPAAGVLYQMLVCGPGKVSALATSGSNTIQVTMNYPWDPDSLPAGPLKSPPPAPMPQVGMRLIIPAIASSPPDYGEYDITGVAGSWVNYPYTSAANFTITLAHALSNSLDGTTSNYQVYYTTRAALVANSGTLRYYPNVGAGNAYMSLVSNVVDPTNLSNLNPLPFSISSSNNQVVQATFATDEPKATRRGYSNINFQTSVSVPMRTVLAHKVP